MATSALAKPPSSSGPKIKGGIGDGYIYPVKPKPKSTMTYYAKPLHPLPPLPPSKPKAKPQIFKVIIQDHGAAKPKKQEQVFKIVHLPSHGDGAQSGGGGGGAAGSHAQGGGPQQSVKILKIIQVKQGAGGGGGGKSGHWS